MPGSTARWFGLLAAAGLCIPAGCGGDDTPSCDVARCDIRKRSCQRLILEAVACMRGDDSDELPPVRVVSEAEYLERVVAYGDDEPEMQADAQSRYARWTRGLALFKLAPPEYHLEDARRDSAAEIAAVYFPDEKDIVILDRGNAWRAHARVHSAAAVGRVDYAPVP